MTQEHTAAMAALKDAEEAVAVAQEKLVELRRVVDEQRGAVDAARRAVYAAQLHTDSFLPPVVILRRTDKTVTVKYLGNKDGNAVQFRPNKCRPDVWSEYPAPKGYSSTWRELEFPAPVQSPLESLATMTDTRALVQRLHDEADLCRAEALAAIP